jgi:4-diphosphocytidyl-2-C-methyl-D-erythritol kinase
MSRFKVRSPAKINLFLEIKYKREDGYHEMESLMLKVGLYDQLSVIEKSDGESELRCEMAGVPLDESNLIFKALRLYEKKTGWVRPWRMVLDKKIPSGAGLAGGSGNAAAMLWILNALCPRPVTFRDLENMAGEIGSDIPFFLYQENAARVSGRGERVQAETYTERPWVVLVKPGFGVPTAWAYQQWKAFDDKGGSSVEQSTPWGVLRNDLEGPVFQKYIMLPVLKDFLQKLEGVDGVMMSGSGSTIFALVQDREDGERVLRQVQEIFGEMELACVVEVEPSEGMKIEKGAE